MIFWFKIAQIVIAIVLTTVILLQNRGGGVGGVFGGGGGGVYLTKRGLEKKLHILTIILAALFVLVSLSTIWIKA
ncbi:MAG TPA: preprotein translocase subunit SecG [Candidatus Saccharimonadales bacterium]|nr:preprotein translocase subunit SecG [Candidatus Saccharimonadales bacterium]